MIKRRPGAARAQGGGDDNDLRTNPHERRGQVLRRSDLAMCGPLDLEDQKAAYGPPRRDQASGSVPCWSPELFLL